MSYCEHKNEEEYIECKYCTSENDRRQHYAEVERQRQKKIMMEWQKSKTIDSFGISYSFGNRAERRKLAKKYRYTKV